MRWREKAKEKEADEKRTQAWLYHVEDFFRLMTPSLAFAAHRNRTFFWKQALAGRVTGRSIYIDPGIRVNNSLPLPGPRKPSQKENRAGKGEGRFREWQAGGRQLFIARKVRRLLCFSGYLRLFPRLLGPLNQLFQPSPKSEMSDRQFKQELRQLAVELKNGLPVDEDEFKGFQTRLRGFCEACADKNGIRPEMRRLVALRDLGDFSHALSRIRKVATNGFSPEAQGGLEEALERVSRLLDPARHLPPRSFWLSLEEIGDMDVLLPVASRKTFDADLPAALAEANETLPLALLMLDLDHFKKVNDTFGHRYGDEVLKAVAGTVKVTCQGRAKCFRYGGEELAVLCPNCDRDEARAFGERLRRAVSLTAVDDKGPLITVSVGIAETDGTRLASYDDLVNAADSALYRAKKEGRNQVRVFRPEKGDVERPEPKVGSNISLTQSSDQLKILYLVNKLKERFANPKKIAQFLTFNLPGIQIHLDDLIRQADKEAED